MSHTVVRGKPFASQLYLDGILDEVLLAGVSGAAGREGISLPQIMFHCLRKNPSDVFMINAATGDKITNSQIFKKAVPIARSLISKGARGRNVIFFMRNHETMAAIYFAHLFAGTVPCIMDPNSTVFEITYFLKLIEPCAVFCDEEHYQDIMTALEDASVKIEVNVSDWDKLGTEVNGGEDVDDFEIPDTDVDGTVMMLPTSGSTGMPKAALMTHRGLVTQLPIIWCYHNQFPSPTDCCMLLTTPQWVTFTMTVTTCVVYRVPVLMSQRKPTVDWVKEMLVTYRPSWVFFGPAFMNTLLPTLTEDHVSSLNTCLLLGAPSSLDMLTALKKKLPPSATLADVYGSTEAQGHITIAVPGAPLNCTGQVVNTYEYKLEDDAGKKVGLGHNGELSIKGRTFIKGYYKNQEAYDETFTDGWLKTGDLFKIDHSERLYYMARKKFCFKFMGSHVSPEEVELVIGSVAGVEESAVCATERGPAVMVVVNSPSVTRELIHKTVNDALSEHKQLHGGIAFVSSLPHTHSGKLLRSACKTLIEELIASGDCF